MKKLGYVGTMVALGAAFSEVESQTCIAPTAAQWKKTVLVNEDSNIPLEKPDHMAVLADGRVFIIEHRSGKVKLYTPNAGVTEVLTVKSYFQGSENGLLGIAVDPEFATTNWVYLFYSRQLTGAAQNMGDQVFPHDQVLMRYTFSGGKLANPKEILVAPNESDRHSAGGLTFNPATGDLFITTGDDTYPSSTQTQYGGRNEGAKHLNSLRSSANTNDLRGKILRIRPIKFPDAEAPTPGVGKTYTIPAGNLYPVGTDKTRPEIYTMGHRNPYKFKIDPVSGYGLIGEVGSDGRTDDAAKGPMGYEEFNLVAKPGNFGWPFGIANNLPFKAIAGEAYPVGTQFDMGNLKNLSAMNTGLTDLPPAVGALGYYTGKSTGNAVMNPFGTSGGLTAIAGPYYRYNADLNSTVKLPAFFHGKFFVGDWSRNKIWSLELDDKKTLIKVQDVTSSVKVIDMDIGPNGELYILEYANNNGYHGDPETGRLLKLEYTGTQYPASACTQYVLPPAGPTALAPHGQGGARAAAGRLVNLTLHRQVAAPAGKVSGILFDLKGAKVWEGKVLDGRLHLPASLENNLAYLQFR